MDLRKILNLLFGAAALAMLAGMPARAEETAAEKIYAELAKLPPEERQARIEEGAKAEGGTLSLIHSWRGETAKKHNDLFLARYPFVKLDNSDLSAQDATERLVSEESAGRHITDLITTGVDEGQPGLIYAASFPTPMLDRILPEYKGLIYPENRMIPFYWSEHGISYNSSLLPPELVPQSWQDLCNPGLKGQVSYDPIDVYFLNGLVGVLGEEGAINLLKCIGDNDPVIARGHTQRLQLMLAGDHLVQGDNYIYRGTSMKDEDPNTPFAVAWNAEVFGDAGVAMINKNTTHPYTAALYVDWLLSEESQKFADDEYRNPIAGPNSHMPTEAKIVSFTPIDPAVTQRMVDAWNKYVLKR